MDKAELQYVIVDRRCQLPSICVIAFAIGTIKNQRCYSGCHWNKNTYALVLQRSPSKTNNKCYKAWRENEHARTHVFLAAFSFHVTFKLTM